MLTGQRRVRGLLRPSEDRDVLRVSSHTDTVRDNMDRLKTAVGRVSRVKR